MKDNYKKYRILNNIIVSVMIIVSIALGIYYVTLNDGVRIFSAFSIFLTLILPLLISKTKYKLDDKELCIFNIFIFLSHFSGSIINLFNHIYWYDTFIHFLSGFLTFYISYLILKKTDTNINNPLILLIYYVGFSSLVAVGWEIIEYVGDVLFKTNFQHNIDTGVVDTMVDMIVAELGCLLGYLYIRITTKKQNKKTK